MAVREKMSSVWVKKLCDFEGGLHRIGVKSPKLCLTDCSSDLPQPQGAAGISRSPWVPPWCPKGARAPLLLFVLHMS